jgi:hypothetical protein
MAHPFGQSLERPVQGDLGCALGDPGPRPGLGQAQPDQLYIAHQSSLTFGQAGQGAVQFQTHARVMLFGDQKRFVIFNRQGLADLAAPPVVDQLVARDGVRPGGERLGRVPGRPLEMHRQQRLLHQILHIAGRAGHPAREIGAQAHTEQGQTLAIGGGVALQPAQHQCLQTGLDVRHAVPYSRVRPGWLHGSRARRNRRRPMTGKYCSPNACNL